MGSQVVHFEVTGKDGKALQKFYSDAFGWKLDTNNPGGYGMVRAGANSITGGIGGAPPGSPCGGTFYVHTEDPKATPAKIRKLGGRAPNPPPQRWSQPTVSL